MKRTRIKICGIAGIPELSLAAQNDIDAVGVIEEKCSGSGTVSDTIAYTLLKNIPAKISGFFLSAATTADEIRSQMLHYAPTVMQLVNHIEPTVYEELAYLLPQRSAQLVQVVHVEDSSALDAIAVYADFVDAFLLDSGMPSAIVPVLGGTGVVHDWDVSREFVQRSPLPVFLAGGLTVYNVKEAIEYVHPYGVDLYSGVRKDGELDRGKLNAFVQAVRDADAKKERKNEGIP